MMFSRFFKMRKKQKDNINFLKARAFDGDRNAQFELAEYYDETEQYEESVKWLTAAAENGHNDAKYWLALHYYTGTGVKKEYGKVIQLAEDLLNKGNDLSGAKLLGDVYNQNSFDNIYYDPGKAEKYYLQVMRSGNPEFWLGTVKELSGLYGSEYKAGEPRKSAVSNPLKAVYCFYLRYLSGDKEAEKEIKAICSNADIAISDEQMKKWKEDYLNIRCSI